MTGQFDFKVNVNNQSMEELEADLSSDVINQKSGSKIKALQNLLIKQALPFANPALLNDSPARRSKSMDALNEIKDSEESQSSYVARQLSNPSTSSLKQLNDTYSSFASSRIPKLQKDVEQLSRQSSFKKSNQRADTLSRVTETNDIHVQSNDSCFDDDTKIRIALAKSKLQEKGFGHDTTGSVRL